MDRMQRWKNKVAVVTGASSGIGAAIVKELVLAGFIVVGLARRVDRVDELKKELPADKDKYLFALKCDVSSENSVNECFDWIVKNLGGIDVLVNNAGCTRHGQLVTMDTKLIQEVVQTNLMGIVFCTQRAFKSMKERDFNGHVVIINSVAGHKVLAGAPNSLPITNIYSPSKFAVTAITEMYRQEFKGFSTKIKITSVSPGAVDTEIITDNVKPMLAGRILKSSDIAQAVLYAISTPPHVQIHEMKIKPIGEMF